MTPRRPRAIGALCALCALCVVSVASGCGDTTSDLITDRPDGSGGSSAGTSAGTGGTPECTVHDDCTDVERIYCHPMRRTCVECTEEAHCDDDEDCSPELGECATSCSNSAGCANEDEDRFCDPLILVCVECLDDADCPSNQCSNWQCGD